MGTDESAGSVTDRISQRGSSRLKLRASQRRDRFKDLRFLESLPSLVPYLQHMDHRLQFPALLLVHLSQEDRLRSRRVQELEEEESHRHEMEEEEES